MCCKQTNDKTNSVYVCISRSYSLTFYVTPTKTQINLGESDQDLRRPIEGPSQRVQNNKQGIITKNAIVVTRLEYSDVACHVVLLYSVDWTKACISFIFTTINLFATKLLPSVVWTLQSKIYQTKWYGLFDLSVGLKTSTCLCFNNNIIWMKTWPVRLFKLPSDHVVAHYQVIVLFFFFANFK